MGLSAQASRERLSFTLDMKKAVLEADLVQENGPERPDFKIKLFADIDAATPPDSIIASSSSGITMSVMQSACKHPERCVVGHPFNPPHMIPLVRAANRCRVLPSWHTARPLRRKPHSPAYYRQIEREVRGTVALAGCVSRSGPVDERKIALGQGIGGFGRYFGAAYGDFVIGDYMTEAVFPVLLHQDPRPTRYPRSVFSSASTWLQMS